MKWLARLARLDAVVCIIGAVSAAWKGNLGAAIALVLIASYGLWLASLVRSRR
jgi:hypothetical protein